MSLSNSPAPAVWLVRFIVSFKESIINSAVDSVDALPIFVSVIKPYCFDIKGESVDYSTFVLETLKSLYSLSTSSCIFSNILFFA